jgi:hypothetical protein
LKLAASCARRVIDSWNARLALARVADAFASLSEECVLHFAAE